MQNLTRRLVVAVISAGTLVLASPAAGLVVTRPTIAHSKLYARLYDQVADRFGPRAPGRNVQRWGLSTGGRATDADLARSISILERMLAPAPVAQLSSTPAITYSSGGYSSVPGVPASYAACVALRESTNGAGSPDIYGILPSNGYYPGMSVAAQKALFGQMYGTSGTAPWTPWDGC